MAPVTTHKGGPFYDWYESVYGYAPPATVDSNAARYLAWQQGIPKSLAATIPYGAIGDPSLYLIGSAVVAPVQVTTPSSPAPVTAPASTVLEQGVTEVSAAPQPAPEALTAPVAAPVATAASASYPTQYGSRYTAHQIDIVRTYLNECLKYHAPRIVMEAMVYSLMGESNISDEVDNGGPLQTTCNMSAYDGGRDWAAQADAWLNSGECFARGGLSYANEYDTAWQIAGATEENKVWGDSKGDSYPRDGATTASLTAEAANAVAYFLPGLGTPVASTPTPTSAPNVSSATDSIGTAFAGLNWAGDFENLWKYVVGGSNEAAHLADSYRSNRVNNLTVIGWS
jgi:hypothetical protein